MPLTVYDDASCVKFSHLWIAADAPIILRQAAGQGFSKPRSFQTELDGQCPNASGC
jgi:hypothetical protein